MKCVICKEGDLQLKNVSVNFDRKGALLVIRKVPACVCDSCGEQYFDDEVTKKLLDIIKNTLKPGFSLNI